MGRLIPAMLVAAAIGLATPATAAETAFGEDAVVRQFVALVPERPARLADRLAADLPPGTGLVPYGPDGFLLSYAGTAPPASLLTFLSARFDGIGEGDLGPRRALNVSLHLSPAGDGTEVRAVIVMPRTAESDDAAEDFHGDLFGTPMPEGSEVLVDGGSGQGSRDLVLAVRGRPSDISVRYAELMTDAGFSVTRQPMDARTLLFGTRRGAAAFVFVQADPESRGRSLLVIRSLEE